ncbi:MAG TPA: protein kinase [Gemmatimonadaceae bacterium]|nr:protein kinase [Gemmatimonadaceae bacterium]
MAYPDPRASDAVGSISPLAAAVAERYRVERKLGAGGMATVYLAEDLKHHRRVAIKVLRPALAAVIGVERFLREIETIAALQHPHILGLIDSGEASGSAYFVMPYVEGESLRDRLAREKQLPIPDALRIASEVASALDYAHRHGVIHRDIKPENILLHDGSALVADFGIALAVSNTAGNRMTETGMSLGTPHYMSPEQAMGERNLDSRTDVYALGCVLYEMLAGEPPFTGPTAQAIVAKVVTATPEPLTTYRKTVPPAIEDAVLTALEKLPADRFSSAREFAEALEGKAIAIPVSARTTRRAAPHPGWKATLRNPIVWGLGLVTLASLAFAFHERTSPRLARSESVVRFAVDLPEDHQPALWDTQGPHLAISPDGTTLAFSVTDPRGARRLFIRRMDEAAGRIIPGTENAFLPVFSADGTSLLFWTANRFQKVALNGGAPQVVGEPGPIQAESWLPGGEIVYAALSQPQLMRMPATGGQGRPAAPLDSARGEVAQYFPHALPDGRHVLYTSRGRGSTEDARIGLLDLSTGRARRLDVPGIYALGMLDRQLIFTDQAGTIMAVPLDLESGETRGQPVPLGDGVATSAFGSAVATLSATGTLAYLGGDQTSKLVLANASGETPLLAEARMYSQPRYSPDGERVALSIASGTASDIWIDQVASGNLTRLTTGGSVNERPEWSSDGSRVLFRTDRGARSALWWQPSDGSGPASPLLADDSTSYFEGVMSPDGRTLVYQVDISGANVMMRGVDGDSVSQPIANAPVDEEQPRVSPDGKWVAYVTYESEGPQVVVQPLPGPGAKVQISIRGGSEPVWSRDGRQIYYRSEGKFKVAEVSATPTFHVTSRADFMDDKYLPSVVPHANYDVSPDGTRLLVLKGERQRLLVVHNWGAEARAKLRGTSPP